MKYIFAIPFVAAIVGAMWALGAWTLMLAVGVIHADWLHSVPTIGFHAAFPLSWAVATLTGSIFGTAGVLGVISRKKKR